MIRIYDKKGIRSTLIPLLILLLISTFSFAQDGSRTHRNYQKLAVYRAADVVTALGLDIRSEKGQTIQDFLVQQASDFHDYHTGRFEKRRKLFTEMTKRTPDQSVVRQIVEELEGEKLAHLEMQKKHLEQLKILLPSVEERARYYEADNAFDRKLRENMNRRRSGGRSNSRSRQSGRSGKR